MKRTSLRAFIWPRPIAGRETTVLLRLGRVLNYLGLALGALCAMRTIYEANTRSLDDFFFYSDSWHWLVAAIVVPLLSRLTRYVLANE